MIFRETHSEFKLSSEKVLEQRIKNLEEIVLNLKTGNTPGQIRTAVAGSKVLHD